MGQNLHANMEGFCRGSHNYQVINKAILQYVCNHALLSGYNIIPETYVGSYTITYNYGVLPILKFYWNILFSVAKKNVRFNV